jgi:hypothetical protein
MKKSVYCQCYDQSSLDVCLLMILLVSCGKMTSLILLHLYDPANETLWQYYHVVPSCFYLLMLERRCQSLG